VLVAVVQLDTQLTHGFLPVLTAVSTPPRSGEIDEERCVAVLHVHYKPHGIAEHLADELGGDERLVSQFLDQYAGFVENMD
jgi:hypothetical protein